MLGRESLHLVATPYHYERRAYGPLPHLNERRQPMQLFSHRSGPSVTSHVDLGPDAVNSDHPAYDITRALADGVVPIHEARIAMAMAMGEELKGFRHIERASGITDDAILKVIPEAGASTTLLSCTNRGKFAYEEDDRRYIDLRLRPYRPDSGHHRAPSSNSSKDQGYRGLNDLEDEGVIKEKPSGVRHVSRDTLDLLDPSLDLWNNAAEGYAERQEFGDAGWALAVVTGMKPTTFTPDELCRITRVGERQARRIVDRLVKWGWAKRIREGRRVRVVVDFSFMTHEDYRDDYLKTTRKARKAMIHQHEGRALKRLGTKVGRLVREIWENRKTEIRMFMDWATETGSQCWDALIKILSRGSCKESPTGLHRWIAENQIFEYFKPYLKDLTA